MSETRPLSTPSVVCRLGLALLVATAVAPVFVLCALLCLPFRGVRIRLGNVYAKIVGYSLAWILGIRWTLIHGERLGAQPAIYICNHTSTADFFFGSALCPMGGCGVAKKEIVRIPVAGQMYWLTGHLRIDRGNPKRARASLKELAAVVKRHGLSVWMWPEGTRSRDGRLLPFKRGIVHIACATGLPIVPIVIRGMYRRWEPGGFTIRPGAIEVEVFPPIDTSEWRANASRQHAAALRQVFIDALPEDQQPLDET